MATLKPKAGALQAASTYPSPLMLSNHPQGQWYNNYCGPATAVEALSQLHDWHGGANAYDQGHWASQFGIGARSDASGHRDTAELGDGDQSGHRDGRRDGGGHAPAAARARDRTDLGLACSRVAPVGCYGRLKVSAGAALLASPSACAGHQAPAGGSTAPPYSGSPGPAVPRVQEPSDSPIVLTYR